METQYYKWYSPALGREMECKSYGHGGKPVLFIPCQDGRFFDFEGFHMTDYWSEWLENGKAMVFSIDTMDKESWSDKAGDPYWRIRRYEAWIQYITKEVVPFIRNIVNERNGWEEYPGIMVFGCSLGATHAVNLYLRFPDLFDRMIALSGIYTSAYGFDDYMDEVVYNNSPVHYLRNLPADHPYVERLNNNKGVICVGQGAWEIPDTTRELDTICAEKGIKIWFDYWGFDCNHDWDWWYKQVTYFLPKMLE